MAHLLSFKKTLKTIVPLREQQNAYYAKFAVFLENYEQAKEKKTSASTGDLSHIRLISGGSMG